MRFRCFILSLLFLTLLNTGKLFASDECVVFVSDRNYLDKFLKTLQQLTTNGNYHGDICLVIGDDLIGDPLLDNPLIKINHVIIKHFPTMKFNPEFLELAKLLPNFDKIFRYHKFHVFDTYFKRWQYVFYIDSGMEIYSDISPILALKQPHTLLAHSDAYPTYVWKLRFQFEYPTYCLKLSHQFENIFSSYLHDLEGKFDLNIDYFQTTMMLYDTSIITDSTVDDLYNLSIKYPISNTHDQGVIALYFTNVKPVWKQIPLRNEETYFYDFMKRGRQNNFIMIKYPGYN